MTKILMITCRSDHGGGPKHISLLLEALEGKFDFFVAAPSSGHYFDFFSHWSNKTINLPHRRFSLSAFFKLCLFVQRHGIDIIHSHGRGAGYYSRLVRLFLPRIKVVHTHHGFYYQRLRGMKHIVLFNFEKFISNFTDAYIFVSQSEMKTAAHTGLLEDQKSFLIPNGIHIVPLLEPKTSLTTKKLITVTRLEPEKGNDILIRIAAELSLRRKDFVLIIVGDGSERLSLEALAKNLGVQDHVQFLKHRNDVPLLLADSDVFVSASLGEAQGIAVIEAMIHGVPVVVSRVLGHVDIVESGRTGFLFAIDSPMEAAEKINALITDPELWREIRLSAYVQAIEKFSAKRMAKETEEVYLSLQV